MVIKLNFCAILENMYRTIPQRISAYRPYAPMPVRRTIGRPIPPKRVNVSKNGKNGNGNGGKGIDKVTNIISTYFDFVKRAVFDSTFIVCMAIATFLMIGYETDENNFIKSVIIKLKATDAFGFLGTWLEVNVIKGVGFVAFLPAILSVAGQKQGITILCSILWVWLIPEHTPYEYLIQGLLLYLFMKTSSDKFKLTTIALSVFMYLLQFGFTTKDLDCTKITKSTGCVRNCLWKNSSCVVK